MSDITSTEHMLHDLIERAADGPLMPATLDVPDERTFETSSTPPVPGPGGPPSPDEPPGPEGPPEQPGPDRPPVETLLYVMEPDTCYVPPTANRFLNWTKNLSFDS